MSKLVSTTQLAYNDLVLKAHQLHLREMIEAIRIRVATAHDCTDPTSGGNSEDLFPADSLLTEDTLLKSILEVKASSMPSHGEEKRHHLDEENFWWYANPLKGRARSTTRARCTCLSTSVRVASPPTSPSTRRTRRGDGAGHKDLGKWSINKYTAYFSNQKQNTTD
ncbi:serrate protein [Culex quinquefasciatus]|uniref:Serrate protein n=1 Tax=Culex quinquefasciatus TaxID=7176 RepID=B0WJI8_CULQU|nr:serrate protein [Culex quinquefasciatus]|eukprot:XP_001848872.1 serrate protein [Culex quinquefasciatus]